MDLLHDIFGGDYPNERLAIYQVAARAVLVYIAGVVIVRLGKSRLIARATPLDVLMGFMLGSVLARGVTGNASLSGTVTATVVLVATHWVLTRLALSSHALGDLVKGHAYVLIEDGRVIEKNRRKSHISEHDLIEELRMRGVERPDQVKRAYKERSGEVSVIPARGPAQVIEVGVKEGVQTIRIELAGS